MPFFQTVAMLLLCLVFFLLPFGLRGARFAVQEMQNNVADWLPGDYEETIDLGVFRRYFVGDVFVILSGPWCRENNGAYANLKQKIFEESLEYEQVLRNGNQREIVRAHRVGDQYGLLPTGDYHEDWGLHRERWLQGKDGKWFWINRRGELWEWEGENNVVDGLKRFFERTVNGRNVPSGRYIEKFGPPPDDARGIENPFYNNPELLAARPFKSVTSGPEVLEKMAGENGTLRIGKFGENDAATFEARIEAHKRLTGALFGPTPPTGYSWSFDSLIAHVGDEALVKQLESGAVFRQKFEAFVDFTAAEEFGGDATALDRAPAEKQLELWYRLWDTLELPPPARQTSLVVTINSVFFGELDRIVGRPLMGRPRGRILELATGECGLDSANVHMGGPPSDNVAIDEEGTSSLLKLASLSGLIGVILSYYSFRSLRITLMLFFLGAVAAISSLSYVWFGGSTLDAILMTMPSLIYVMAISSGVHFINYYREACHEFGPSRATEIAISRSWFPCLLAAFTTAIGLASLCTSNLTPIFKFGLFSAVAVMATVVFLYLYLPSSLVIWPPGYRKQRGATPDEQGSFYRVVSRFWTAACEVVIRNNLVVLAAAVLLMVVFAFGVTRVTTTVQLLKLFDKNAKVLQDYRWLESNLGTLVPMEILINVDRSVQAEAVQADQAARLAADAPPAAVDPDAAPAPPPVITDVRRSREQVLAFNLLERMEMGYRIRRQLERFFGPEGLNVVGAGMSTDVFAPLHTIDTQVSSGSATDFRRMFNDELQAKKGMMAEEDYLAVVPAADPSGDGVEPADAAMAGREMWRISLRLAALNDVDYGQFVTDLKAVVEPILRAYEIRTRILEKVVNEEYLASDSRTGRILLLGAEPRVPEGSPDLSATSGRLTESVDQGYLFRSTLQDLLENRGFVRGYKPGCYFWVDPAKFGPEKPFYPAEEWNDLLKKFDCVVLVDDHRFFDAGLLATQAPAFVDCRDHRFDASPRPGPFAFSMTASNRQKAGQATPVTATYTGIVPIVYKAQRALLYSLVESLVMSFLMISVTMMVLLRNWRTRVRPGNLLSFRAGILSMIPNVFPVIMIFGAMGFLRIKVDIGSMMTASVALGIAVDDTIHFLTWYRHSLAEGKSRLDSIRTAYSLCASAMTQTTLIAGFGLSVFALSTFQPTQRFGVLMLALLAIALIGDLIVLPALLASPLGRYFGTPAVLPVDGEVTGGSELAGEWSDPAGPPVLPLQRPVVEDPEKRSRTGFS